MWMGEMLFDVAPDAYLPVAVSRLQFAALKRTSPHSRSGRAHALEYLSLIAAHNRCASGVRAALPVRFS